ncbi:MAG: DUF6078 family protein [Tannerellaceae bacterium]|jgi:hypothetical protein|nr:DUF6078 family protein [Tannerellaceae bacterium]
MRKIDSGEIPKRYLYCHHGKCPHRAKCLRYQAALAMPKELLPVYETVNPHHIAGNEDNCTFFKTYATLRFATGMDHLLDHIPHKVATAIKKDIYALMGRSMYYRVCSRERTLHPAEQNQIAAIFRKHGIKAVPEFDVYVEKYDWK